MQNKVLQQSASGIRKLSNTEPNWEMETPSCKLPRHLPSFPQTFSPLRRIRELAGLPVAHHPDSVLSHEGVGKLQLGQAPGPNAKKFPEALRDPGGRPKPGLCPHRRGEPRGLPQPRPSVNANYSTTVDIWVPRKGWELRGRGVGRKLEEISSTLHPVPPPRTARQGR